MFMCSTNLFPYIYIYILITCCILTCIHSTSPFPLTSLTTQRTLLGNWLFSFGPFPRHRLLVPSLGRNWGGSTWMVTMDFFGALREGKKKHVLFWWWMETKNGTIFSHTHTQRFFFWVWIVSLKHIWMIYAPMKHVTSCHASQRWFLF